jgi:hypothetical protein
MLRRLAVVVLAIAWLALAVPGPEMTAARPLASPRGVELPESGALFGTFLRLDEHNGFERRKAMLDFEALVGRKMAVDRQYYLWEEMFPTADDYWSRDQGRTLYLSWNASRGDGSGCSRWADIAAGIYDADIDARAVAVSAFGAPLFFAFHHEPMTGPPGGETCGTPAEFIDAWRHVRERFIANGVTNVTWAVTFTAWSFMTGAAEDFYPGDAHTDLIAADGYNWFGCQHHQGPWREFDLVFNPFYLFGEAHNKPMFIAEYGTGEDPDVDGRKGQWFTNMAQTLKEWPLIKGVSYFNVGTTCTRYVDSSQSSLDAFQADGADPYFNPPLPVTDVSVADFSYSPRGAVPFRGTEVKWTFNGPSDHTVTDSSTMGLFDSGALSAGGTFRHYFIGAGAYSYHCTIHPIQMTGQVRVPMAVTPRSGDLDSTFTVTWAANHAPTGHVFDIQIKRPSAGWSNWRIAQTLETATFGPDAGVGTYQFRARYRVVRGAASGWSRPFTIVVG